MKLDWLTFQRIKWYFRRQEPVVYRHHPIRTTLLRNSKILCEYDFIQKQDADPVAGTEQGDTDAGLRYSQVVG
jgi:hypothetical protein